MELALIVDRFHPLFSALFLGLGGIFGSFINVVIYRLPRDESIVRPGSHCPACNAPIRWYDNIPVFSYLALRGRCRRCAQPISLRYPLVELICAVLCWTLFQHLGLSIRLATLAPFSLALVAITFIDIDSFYIPDVISLPGIALGVGLAVLTGEPTWRDSLMGLCGGAGILTLVLLAFKLVMRREGMGWGDVKLLGFMGAVLGVWAIPAIILLGSLQGIVIGSLWLWYSKRHEAEIAARSDDDIPSGAVPFGPFLTLGALEWIFAQERLLDLFARLRSLVT
jgi:leader peptidase (prepilin peptidase) / N-methyltransferase